MIIDSIFFCDHMAYILLDSGSTLSYVSKKFSICRDLDCEYLDTLTYVSILVAVFICVNKVYSMCIVIFVGLKTLKDSDIFYMEEFDIILGMSWCFPYMPFLIVVL